MNESIEPPDPFGEDEEEELAVIQAPGAALEEAAAKRRRARAVPERPKGNTSREEAPAARARLMAEATGRAHREPDAWREQLAAGDKGKAVATLTSRRLTHNAGTGFGLAGQPRYDD